MSEFLLVEYIKFLIQNEEPLMKNKKIKNGAGFILVKKFKNEWKVLGLKINGEYDLPKGKVDKKDRDIFHTAQRECYEECGISVSSSNLVWGDEHYQLGPVSIFLAKTNEEPIIRPNPKSGIYEHDSAEWLTWDELLAGIKGYLIPAVVWAKTKINP